MRISRGGLTAWPAFLLGLLLVLMVAGTSAQTSNDNNDAAATAANTAANTATNTAATTQDDSLPALTTAASSSESNKETASASASGTASATSDNSLPTLSSTASSSYNYPPPSVPPTENAPYMRKSKAPEGTVFIAVGAALGFIGMVILLWRAMVAWSVNRSVRKAAEMQARSEKKALLAGRRRRRSRRRSTVYSEAPGSTMSLDKIGTGYRSSQVPPMPKSNTRTSGLFYSPTAGAGMQGNANRTSTYLPAGYYASSNTALSGSSVGLSNLGAQSQGYTRTGSGSSPPASPLLSPNLGHDRSYRGSQARMSTTSLNVPPQGRAPSTYLEDLFDSHHTPGSDMEYR
ncbi:conserved hypothetical protein [Paecilomyces variotii No. 5]|uniref:Uncharacterized protein n=1 Tax=Byssochlamys spectabilis (strain No. 5 / NBRC 109023) TaxID=1356009 RepID=V5FWE2_BYSSN|nr:conserved hypothetical protein [Paecilomyces variotii No. 5]